MQNEVIAHFCHSAMESIWIELIPEREGSINDDSAHKACAYPRKKAREKAKWDPPLVLRMATPGLSPFFVF